MGVPSAAQWLDSKLSCWGLGSIPALETDPASCKARSKRKKFLKLEGKDGSPLVFGHEPCPFYSVLQPHCLEQLPHTQQALRGNLLKGHTLRGLRI